MAAAITLFFILQTVFIPVAGWTIHPYQPFTWTSTIVSSVDPSVQVIVPHIPPLQLPIINPPVIVNPNEPSTSGGGGGTQITNPGNPSITSSGGGGGCNPADPLTWGNCIAQQMWNFFSGLINSVIQGIQNAIKGVIDGIVYAGKTIGQFIINIFTTIANGILRGIELLANMPTQFLNGYWELTIGSLVDTLATLGPIKPFVAPIAYAALIGETIPVVVAMGYLAKFIVEAFKIALGGVL